MEFVCLDRYIEVENGHISKFNELKQMKPLLLNQDLEVICDPENLLYLKKLASLGHLVVPIRRISVKQSFKDRIEFPRRVLFEMTSNCNFLCRMCPQQNLKRPRMDMDKNLYMKVVDELDKHGIEGIWLYHLGESLLHPDFKEILAHVSEKKGLGKIWFSTNGEYFTEDNIQAVLNSSIDYVNFSAHAVTAETYETVTEKNFDVVNSNLEKFYELKGVNGLPRKPFLHCQMIEQETTKHEVDAFIEKHYKRADIVSINMLEYVNLENNKFGIQQRERKTQKSCVRVERNDCFICSNGVVTLCDAAYNGEINLGNVNEDNLFDIWNGEERKRLLDLSRKGEIYKNEFCRFCTDYDI